MSLTRAVDPVNADSTLTHAAPESPLAFVGPVCFATAVAVVLVASGSRTSPRGALERGRGRRPSGTPGRKASRASTSQPARPAPRAGIQPGDMLLAVNGQPVQRRADVIAFQHRADAGTPLSYTLLRLGSRQALDVTLTAAPSGARCTSCSRPSGCSRCSSAPRSVCAGRAIRRRCISSGCASRSSACSRSRSTVRSIGSTGCSSGATRSRWRCCRRCCCISRWCFPSGRRGAARRRCGRSLPLDVRAGARAGRRRACVVIVARSRRTVRRFRARWNCSIGPSTSICSCARSRPLSCWRARSERSPR